MPRPTTYYAMSRRPSPVLSYQYTMVGFNNPVSFRSSDYGYGVLDCLSHRVLLCETPIRAHRVLRIIYDYTDPLYLPNSTYLEADGYTIKPNLFANTSTYWVPLSEIPINDSYRVDFLHVENRFTLAQINTRPIFLDRATGKFAYLSPHLVRQFLLSPAGLTNSNFSLLSQFMQRHGFRYTSLYNVARRSNNFVTASVFSRFSELTNNSTSYPQLNACQLLTIAGELRNPDAIPPLESEDLAFRFLPTTSVNPTSATTGSPPIPSDIPIVRQLECHIPADVASFNEAMNGLGRYVTLPPEPPFTPIPEPTPTPIPTPAPTSQHSRSTARNPLKPDLFD